jgi:hypothetical protein
VPARAFSSISAKEAVWAASANPTGSRESYSDGLLKIGFAESATGLLFYSHDTLGLAAGLMK